MQILKNSWALAFLSDQFKGETHNSKKDRNGFQLYRELSKLKSLNSVLKFYHFDWMWGTCGNHQTFAQELFFTKIFTSLIEVESKFKSKLVKIMWIA